MFYRVKQFYLAMTAKVSEKEWAFVRAHLDEKEQGLFEKLQVSEQKHCVNVAADIGEAIPKRDQNRAFLIRLGLLHDIGKIRVKLNPIDKSIIVILDKLTKGKIKKQTKNKKINSYYNHGEIGSKILREIGGYGEWFLEMIENHHEENIKNDPLLEILQTHDDNN